MHTTLSIHLLRTIPPMTTISKKVAIPPITTLQILKSDKHGGGLVNTYINNRGLRFKSQSLLNLEHQQKMKITAVLLLVTLSLVCSAYAAPVDVQKQIYSLLRPTTSIQDLESSLIPLEVIAALLFPLEYGLLRKFQGKNNDDTNIEALLQSLQDETDMEEFGSLIRKLGKGAVKVGKKYKPTFVKGTKKYGKEFGEQILVNRLVNGGQSDEGDNTQAEIEDLASLFKNIFKDREYEPTDPRLLNKLTNWEAQDDVHYDQ